MEVDLLIGATWVNLSDGTLCWCALSRGLGMGVVERYKQRGPDQTGQSDVGYNLAPRVIEHIFELVADGSTSRLEKMQSFLGLLVPRSTPYTLRYTREDAVARLADVHLRIGPELATADRRGLAGVRAAVQFDHDAGVFYGATQQQHTFGLNSFGLPQMAIPTPIPTTIGSSAITSSAEIEYAGDWPESPVFEVTGPITDLIITNTAAGDDDLPLTWSLTFAGATVPSGETWQIDTRYERTRVTRMSDGERRTQFLANGHNLATFRLHVNPAERYISGHTVNTLSVTGRNASTATTIVMRHYERFTSVYS